METERQSVRIAQRRNRHFFAEVKAETRSDMRQIINIEKAALCPASLESTIILVSGKRRDQFFVCLTIQILLEIRH